MKFELENELGYPLIICSYKLFEYCSERYPNRIVVADMHVDQDDFYYWNRQNVLKIVSNKKEIWVLGDTWPSIVRRR